MRLLEHRNNNNAWNHKHGDACARDVAKFAKSYQRSAGATAWAVVVVEGLNWISAHHIRDVISMTRSVGALVVWVSDGNFAQCIWNKGGAE